MHQLKPRNPLVAAAKFKRAGQHGRTMKAARRHDKMKTLREVRCISLKSERSQERGCQSFSLAALGNSSPPMSI